MRMLFVLCVISQLLFPQSDLLRQKFSDKLHAIANRTDAVVGIAVKDLKSGEQILINEKESFPTASSIKIFILAEVFRQASEGKFKMTDVRPVPANTRVGGSGILTMLGAKSVSMSIRDYCVLMMNLSDNTATNLLIDLVGMKNVNDFAVKNGCATTTLQRVMMDVQASKEGRENISSPADFLSILEKLYRGEVVSPQASEEMLSIMTLEKEGPLRNGIPLSISLANKGGEIDGVRCDVGIVYLENAPYVVCVMTKMLLKDSAGPEVIRKISKSAYEYFERKANSNQHGRRIPK